MRTVDSELAKRIRSLAVNHPWVEMAAIANSAEVARISFHISLVVSELRGQISIADVGGGIGLFSLACASCGMKTFLVDDFKDPGNRRVGNGVLSYHRSLGIQVLERDVIADGLGLEPGSLDAVTSFDSMEHWHASPKRLFREIMAALKPGGMFVLGVPNNVNLRKRLTVPLGLGDWSSMSEWYEETSFRGHVREPCVRDLSYIAQDLALVDHRILGRNWLGYQNKRPWVRALTPAVDLPLRLFPSLCSDIYLIGRKAGE
jgi:SAM-dependent methyltransferase